MELNILEAYTKLYKAYEAQKHFIPEGNLFEVKFEDFEKNALETTRKAYAQLQIPGFKEAEPAIEAYVNKKKGYKKNKYEYKPRTVQLVNEHWGYALKDWGYDMH